VAGEKLVPTETESGSTKISIPDEGVNEESKLLPMEKELSLTGFSNCTKDISEDGDESFSYFRRQ
jgi:hypothetical protein